MSKILGLDIGGAFIKWSLLNGNRKPKTGIVHFEMYKQPKQLETVLRQIAGAVSGSGFVSLAGDAPLAGGTPLEGVGVTMTGELCDCFRSRREGVRHIAAAVVKVFGGGTFFYSRDGSFLQGGRVLLSWREVASANWSAVPMLLAERLGDFLYMDIGSTTTDVIPVRGGMVAAKGVDDFSRMRKGELIYTGYLRTALPSFIGFLLVDGKRVPLSSEAFAIMGDVHLPLGNIKKSSYSCGTPDGRAATPRYCLERLARCVLSEYAELGKQRLMNMARQVADKQAEVLQRGAKRVGKGLPVLVFGSGGFILQPAIKRGQLQEVKPQWGKRYELVLPELKQLPMDKLDASLAVALLLKRRG